MSSSVEGQSEVISNDAAAMSRGSDWSADTLTLVAVVLAGAVGTGLFFRTIVPLTLGPFVALMVALGCRRWWSAGLVAAAGVFASFFLASRVSVAPWNSGLFWLRDAAATAGIAVLLGVGLFLAIKSSARLRPLLSALGVVVVIGTMWYSGLVYTASPSGQGWIPVERLTATVNFTPQMADEDVYIALVSQLHQGERFYPTEVAVFARANETRGSELTGFPLKSPLSYRLPTLYWLLAALPYNGASFVMAMLVACTLGVACAYVLARQYVTAVPALAGAAFVASTFAGFTGPSLLDPESWAGIFGLAAVLFMVLSYRKPSRALGLQLAAVAFAVTAALFRELAVAFLLVGLASALVDRREVARRYWVVWVAGMVVTFCALAAHWSAATAAFQTVKGSAARAAFWFHPDASGLASAVRLLASHAWLVTWVAWLLLALGMVGSVLAPRDLPSRVALAGVCIGGPFVLLFLRPSGWATYGSPGYWGDLVTPTILACVPLASVWLTAARAEKLTLGSN